MGNTYAELVFVRLVIPLVLGIILFYPLTEPLPYGIPVLTPLVIIALLMSLLLGALGYLNLCYAKFGGPKIKPFVIGSFCLLPFIFGCWITLLHKEILQPNHFSRHTGKYLEVIINDEPQLKGNTLRFPVKVLRSLDSNRLLPVNGHLMVSINTDEKPLKLSYGDQILIPATFKAIAATKNPYEFDAKRWYSRQNIHHQSFLQPEQYIIQKRSQGNFIKQWALEIRKKQVLLFRRLIKQDEAYAVASTLILGYRSELSEETLMAYSKTGTIHALSVSGMHVGLIYIIINFLLGFLDKWKSGKVIKLLLSITLIWIYALIAGLAPSVLRSAIMLSVFIVGNTFKKNKNSYNLLAFSACCILIYDPMLLYDVGFQLSYMSVLGLIYLQPYIQAWFNFKYPWANKIWGFIALSLAAQIATFPLATYYFHQFPVYFLVSNLFILIPVSLIMYLGLLILICPANVLASCFEWLLKFTNAGLRWIADLPYASISKIWFSNMELWLLSAFTLFLCLAFSKYNKRFLVFSLSAMTILVLSLSIKHYNQTQRRSIIIFSVQKGTVMAFIDNRQAWVYSSIVPGSKPMLYYVLPALDQAGVQSISYITTHEIINKSQIQIKDHQINFFSYKLLLADSCFNGRKLTHALNLNALSINRDAKLDLEGLLEQANVQTIFLDANRTEYQAERYKNVLKHFELSIHDLKIKKAYLINLKK